MNRNRIILFIAGIFVAGLLFTACGTQRSHCNTKGKTRTEMGWM